MKFNTSKEDLKSALSICLSKAGYADDTTAKVNIIVDGSSSMNSLYANGTVNELINRALIIGEKFDDDGAIDVFDFSSNGRYRMLDQATQDDFGSYSIDMLGGGTEYAPVIRMMADFYYKETVTKKGGFLGFGGKKVTEAPEGRDDSSDKHPVFCVFITDGETLRDSEDAAGIDEILNKHSDLFIQFVGIGSGCSFSFLKGIAGQYKNADFYDAGNLNDTDQEDFLRGVLSLKAKSVLNA